MTSNNRVIVAIGVLAFCAFLVWKGEVTLAGTLAGMIAAYYFSLEAHTAGATVAANVAANTLTAAAGVSVQPQVTASAPAGSAATMGGSR